eukprot:Gb_29090 [translate_table: standard]
MFLFCRCGEDERPLDELIVLHLGAEHPNGRYNVSMCKIFGKQCNTQDRRRINPGLRKSGVEDHMVSNHETRAETSGREARSSDKTVLAGAQSWKEDLNANPKRLADAEAESKPSSLQNQENLQLKRRKMAHLKRLELEPEQEEHSHSLSQQSSPSQSDQEQTVQKRSSSACTVPNTTSRPPPQSFGIFMQQNQNQQRQQRGINHSVTLQHQTTIPPEVQHQPKVEKFFRLHVGVPNQTMPLPTHNVSQIPPMDPSPVDHTSNNIAQDSNSRAFQNRRPEAQVLADKLPPRIAVAGMVAVPNLVKRSFLTSRFQF